MLRMAPLALAIVSSLFTARLQAEETFDTHFMMGGMQGVKTTNFQVNSDKPMPGEYELDVYINKQWQGKYTLAVQEKPMTPV